MGEFDLFQFRQGCKWVYHEEYYLIKSPLWIQSLQIRGVIEFAIATNDHWYSSRHHRP